MSAGSGRGSGGTPQRKQLAVGIETADETPLVADARGGVGEAVDPSRPASWAGMASRDNTLVPGLGQLIRSVVASSGR